MSISLCWIGYLGTVMAIVFFLLYNTTQNAHLNPVGFWNAVTQNRIKNVRWLFLIPGFIGLAMLIIDCIW